MRAQSSSRNPKKRAKLKAEEKEAREKMGKKLPDFFVIFKISLYS
jgi:hypothetical protein